MELHRESRIFGGGNAVIDLVLEGGSYTVRPSKRKRGNHLSVWKL